MTEQENAASASGLSGGQWFALVLVVGLLVGAYLTRHTTWVWGFLAVAILVSLTLPKSKDSQPRSPSA